MTRLRMLLSPRNILRFVCVYLVALGLFEVCYWHVTGTLAKGFVLGIIEFFATFLKADAFTCIGNMMKLVYCAGLEIFGLSIVYGLCRLIRLRGVIAAVLCLAGAVAMTFCIGPLMAWITSIIKGIGAIILLVFAGMLLAFGAFGSLLIVTGVSRDDLPAEERINLIELGAIWKKL